MDSPLDHRHIKTLPRAHHSSSPQLTSESSRTTIIAILFGPCLGPWEVGNMIMRRPHTTTVGTLANGYIKSAPLPRVTARAAHVTAVTDRCQALTPVPYGLASVPLLSPMTKHRFSHESESFVQPLIMRHHTSSTSSYYLPRLQHTVLIN